MSERLVEAKNLCKYFSVGKKGTLKAVDNVSLYINKGETLGLVGESGCGKTTCGRTILRLYDPTSGQVTFDGKDVSQLKGKELLDFKKRAQIIFQDPYSSLDPRMTIGEIIAEGMDVHCNYTAKEKDEKVAELLRSVGMNPDFANRFAHELSGGQRQRIGIARALAIDPDFIVCDEPISALDVSIQAQVVNLLIKLQKERGLTYLFISHDLSMVRHISDRVGVMYLGSLVEMTASHEIFSNPQHPYTKILMSAIPLADPDAESAKNRIEIQGEVPSPINAPSGCKFRTRCPYATDICAQEAPALTEIAPDHYVACHHCKEINK
ncbi:oligopeptide/dipeptide ABC transporter ATP-binding protein [Roseburia hominis]